MDLLVGISKCILAATLANKIIQSISIRERSESTEALFFPEDSTKTFISKGHLSQKIHQGGGVVIDKSSNLAKVLDCIRNAKVSIDVCLYILTCPEFGNMVLECLGRGVDVRIIVDFTSVQENGLEVNRLRQRGVSIRGQRQQHHIHHKFVIVDSKILLNGSFNWTQTAVTGNNENVVITSNAYLVNKFLAEFNKLWEEHKTP